MTDDTTPEGGHTDARCAMCEYVYAKLIDAQADLAAQSSRLRSLEQRLRDLEGYVQHKPECRALFCRMCAWHTDAVERNHDFMPYACTCGLSTHLSDQG
jgi:hypothetical protein